MGNDMTWEQKCRISALRAACASSYVHRTDVYRSDAEDDVALTTRILARAETFRIALLADGALDYVPDDDETLDANYSHACIRCTKAIRLVRNDNQVERWEDVDGRVLCDPVGILMHTPVEPIGALISGTCRSCMRAIGMHDDGTWIDVAGSRYCGQAQTLMHHAGKAISPPSNVCPGCGSNDRKKRELSESDFQSGLKNLYCQNKWHQEL